MALRDQFESLANQTLGSVKWWHQEIYADTYGESTDYGLCAALSSLWLASRRQTRIAGSTAYRSNFEERISSKPYVDALQKEIGRSVESASSDSVDQLLVVDTFLRTKEGFTEAKPTAKAATACWHVDPMPASPGVCAAPLQVAEFVLAEPGYIFIGCAKPRRGRGAHALAAENVDGKEHIVLFDPNFGRVTWGHDKPGYGAKSFSVFFSGLMKSIYQNKYSEFLAKRYL